MNWFSKKKTRKWLRLFHRDLGYFFVGITLIYAVSGIILNHKVNGEDPAYKTVSKELQIEKGLKVAELEKYWEKHLSEFPINRIMPNSESYDIYLKGGVGNYHLQTGHLQFETYQKKQWVYFINKLHYNSKKGWTYMADFFAITLIFFALSGMFMVPGKKGIIGRGKWLILLGIILPFLFFL